jgi:SAM-dependent methyltransferase
VILVDISPTCLDACKSRFADDRLETFQSSGSDLPPDATGEVDVVWSYDVFVHIAEPQFREYLAGVARVLRAGGVAVIHHGNRRQATLGLGWLRSFRVGRHLYQLISMGHLDDDGWRSNVSGKQVAHWAADVGLTVRAQVCRWGLNSAYGVPRFNDRVTILQKPLGR